jgi:hypothetical protein
MLNKILEWYFGSIYLIINEIDWLSIYVYYYIVIDLITNLLKE